MLRFLTAGESHGPCLTAVIEGCPAGFAFDLATANEDMRRRMLGYGRGGRMKIEQDTIEIRSGIRFGETTPDGNFSLEWASCIGMSDQAPAALVVGIAGLSPRAAFRARLGGLRWA